MKIIFSNFLGHKVPIQLHGSSYRCISAYPSFEMIPLLIIDNAVKYSYQNHVISVNFREDASDLIVEVISYSPHCSENDLNYIYKRISWEKCKEGIRWQWNRFILCKNALQPSRHYYISVIRQLSNYYHK